MINRKNIVTLILLLLVLGLAAVLRLYHSLSIPYMYDEMSSIHRTYYDNFSDLIEKGVYTDVHPAGIQVFLYYWTKLFGHNEIVVKMPFIIFGILAVLYVYLIGKEWFNSTAGLISAAFIATLQYTIMYSQIIRPYMSGMFFSVAMVYHWNKIVFKPGKNFDLHWILYVFFASLCAYNHHFSLLFAAIVGLTGIFFLNRRYLIRYITAGVMIFVLYIPHLHILFYQYSLGGLDPWAKIQHDFLLKYLEYVLQFSPYIYACLAVLFVTGIVYRIWAKTPPNRYVFISLAWCLIPALTGFIYSVVLHPVIEYSGLIFSFPFLLLAIMGLLPEVNGALKTVFVLIICSVNIYVLVFERKHYDIFYHSPYEQNALLTDSVHRALGKDKVISFMELNIDTKRIEQYYVKKYGLDSSFISLDTTMDNVSFADLLEDHPREYLSYASITQENPVHIPMILSDYPYLVKKYDFYGGSFYLFSSKRNKYTSPYIFQSSNYFEQTSLKQWSSLDPKKLNDSIHYSGIYSYKMDSLQEFSPTFSCKLKDMIADKKYLVTASAEIYPLGPLNDVYIVFAIERHGKMISWSSSAIKDFIMYGVRKRWVKAYHALELSDYDIDYPDVDVKVYIWNKGRRKFYLDDFEVKTMKANPIIYGLYEKL